MKSKYKRWIAEGSVHGTTESYKLRGYEIDLDKYAVKWYALDNGVGDTIKDPEVTLSLSDGEMSLNKTCDNVGSAVIGISATLSDEASAGMKDVDSFGLMGMTLKIEDNTVYHLRSYSSGAILPMGMTMNFKDDDTPSLFIGDISTLAIKTPKVSISDDSIPTIKVVDSNGVLLSKPAIRFSIDPAISTKTYDTSTLTMNGVNLTTQNFASEKRRQPETQSVITPVCFGKVRLNRNFVKTPVVVTDEMEFKYFDQAILRIRLQYQSINDHDIQPRVFVSYPPRRMFTSGPSIKNKEYRGMVNDGYRVDYVGSVFYDPILDGNDIYLDPTSKDDFGGYSWNTHQFILNLEQLILDYPDETNFSFDVHIASFRPQSSSSHMFLRTYTKSDVEKSSYVPVTGMPAQLWRINEGYYNEYFKINHNQELLRNNQPEAIGGQVMRLSYNKITNKGTIKVIKDGTENHAPLQPVGVGIAPVLPQGFKELPGTRDPLSHEYGNYVTTGGSVMVWIPRFYYRVGHFDNLTFPVYGSNSIDIKYMDTYATPELAAKHNYVVHRAFYDGGELKKGFFIDKYICSVTEGIATSLSHRTPVVAGEPFRWGSSNPGELASFKNLNGVTGLTFADALKAAKTRGVNFSVPSLFQYRALDMISLYQSQNAADPTACTWKKVNTNYSFPSGATGILASRKGYDHNGNGSWLDSPFNNLLLTGTGEINHYAPSLERYGRTTHNGQGNGVTDLKGMVNEIALGFTYLNGSLQVLKQTTKLSSLTGGTTSITDAWGAKGVANNYQPFFLQDSTFSDASEFNKMGGFVQEEYDYLHFYPDRSGNEWLCTCLGGMVNKDNIPQSGDPLYASAMFSIKHVDNVCVLVGGGMKPSASIWQLNMTRPYNSTSAEVGFRTTLYV